jgi:predicted metalloprotease
VIDVRGGGGRRRGARASGRRRARRHRRVRVHRHPAAERRCGRLQRPRRLDTAARAPSGEPIPAGQDPEKELKDFSVYVFDNAQATWERIFSQQGQRYERAKVVLYRAEVDTACGSASSAVGPFYCPGDMYVYLDLSFYRDMERQLQASGDFGRT